MPDRQELDRLAAQLILLGWEVTSRWEPRDLPPETTAVVLEARQGPLVLEVMADDTYQVQLVLAAGTLNTLPDALADIDLEIHPLMEGEDAADDDPGEEDGR